MEMNDLQLYRELKKRNLRYTMASTLSLNMFNPATWDIFRLRNDVYTHVRVTGVRFGRRHNWPFVASFETCNELPRQVARCHHET